MEMKMNFFFFKVWYASRTGLISKSAKQRLLLLIDCLNQLQGLHLSIQGHSLYSDNTENITPKHSLYFWQGEHLKNVAF